MSKIIISLLIFLSAFTPIVNAQDSVEATHQNLPSEEIIEGEVGKIVDTGKESFLESLVSYQVLHISVSKGSLKDEIIEVKNSEIDGGMSHINYIEYKPGDKIRVFYTTDVNGDPIFSIIGKIKRNSIISLIIIFMICVFVVGRMWGVLSIIGMSISFLVIFKVIIPLIISGYNPVLAAVLGSVIIIPATFYISHGFNTKTHVGVISTIITLLFTGLLAVFFVENTHLTGYASEEAGFLQVERQGSVDIRGLLIAGIIIGVLGILDDVTIGQASVVQQIKNTNPKISMRHLFQKGMKVGQDHISSMVNTLVLVYAGSALPLLLLFFDDQKSFIDIIEFELIAEEIVRMLVGSIGLVLVAPLATALAAYLFTRYPVKKISANHQH